MISCTIDIRVSGTLNLDGPQVARESMDLLDEMDV